MARPHTRRKRFAGVPKMSGAGAFLHWLGMVAMVVGLFAPLANVAEAATIMTPEQAIMRAAQQPLDSDTTDFDRVVLVGDFQQQFGCAPFDVNCDQTELVEANGLWTGVYAIPAGQWQWELIAIDDQGTQYSLEENQVTVNDGQLGVYAEFNSASRQTNVWAVNHVATANGPFGDVALAQDGDGYVATSINADNDGRMDLQVMIDGQPIQTGADFTRGANRVTFDATGNITNVQSLGYAELTVQRMDADGNPLAGSCFVLDGSSQTRGCDTDGDGTTTLLFPAGIQPGGYTLRETTPAQGAEPLADQQFDVQQGDATIEARSEGPAAPENGDLVVMRQDADGNPVGGACFDLIAPDGSTVTSACDEDGDIPDDGRIGLLGVPAGDYTLRESRTPEGVEPAGDTPVTVLPNDVVNQPVQSAALATEPPAPENGDLVVMRQDSNGNPVGGACFELIAPDGSTITSACDEDGDIPDDGRIGLLGVPAGDYTLRESRTPEGVEPAGDTSVTVLPNDVVNQPVQSAAIVIEQPTETEVVETETPTDAPIETETPTETEAPTEETRVGRVIAYRTDENGAPVGGSCFAVVDANGQTINEACDEDGITADDGTTGVVEIPVGDYTLVETRTPSGYQKTPDTPITVGEGDNEYFVAGPAEVAPTTAPTDAPIEPTSEPSEEATEAPTEEATEVPTEVTDGATLELSYPQSDTEPLACVELDTTGSIGMMELPYACDNGENDANPDPGQIEMQNLEAGEFEVVVYEGPAEVTQAETQTVTLVEGEAASVTFEPQAPATTSFSVSTTDGTTQLSGACFSLDNGEPRCDDGSGVTFSDVTPGSHSVQMTSAPDGFNVSDPDTQNIDVSADGSTTATFTVSRSTTSVVITTTDGTNPVGGACYAIAGGEPTCDDGSGSLTVSGVTPGDAEITMTTAPDGYEVAAPQTVTIAADGSTTANFTVSRSTTSVVIATTDGTNPVGGACYAIAGGESTCDDGSGSLTISGVTPGDAEISMTSAPDGYEVAAPQTVTVAADGSTTAAFTLTRSTTSVVIATTDGTNPVGGACYAIAGGEPTCDDGSGSLTISGVTPGDAEITMTSAPDGYEVAAPQTVIIAADGSTTATFTVSLTGKDLVVTTLNGETSELIAGACYTLNDGEPSCDDQGSGQVVFNDVPQTDATLSMESAPEGFEAAADQVVPADVTTIDVPLLAEVGSIQVTILDENSAPLAGACVTVNGTETCDDADGTADGVITIGDLTPGQHSVAVSSVPDGYDVPADAKNVDVVANAAAEASFQLTLTPPTTGSLDVTVLYSDQAPVENVCVTVTSSDSVTQLSACDNADGTVDGKVAFENLPIGTYSVGLQEGFTPDRPVGTVVSASGDVPAEGRGAATLTLPLAPTTGTIQITTTATGGNLGGACFTIDGTVICDNGSGDIDGTTGVIVVEGLEAGDYDVTMSTVPSGYQTPAAQTANVAVNETAELEFALQAIPEPGSVTVTTVDGDGNALNNACYALVQGSNTINTLCDSEPADGQVMFENVPAGRYQLVQTRTPGNQFQTAPTRFVDVAAGENTDVEVVMDIRPGRLTVRTVDRDEPTLLLQNACYVLVGDTQLGPFCDANDGNVDGVVRFTNIPPGDYELRQTVATAGSYPAANRSVTINPAGSLQITVQNAKVQPPAENGTLVVVPLDPIGNPVAGGCYQVFDGDQAISGRICDNADDQPARITIESLPVGEFTLREQLAPSPDWQIAADITVTITNGETTTVEVPHEYKRGSVVIQAVNTVGLPLQGACFTLTDAGNTDLCTDATGQATVTDLAPGNRQLTQTQAPFGFKLDTNPREVIVRPGQTTTVRVVFQNAPPPNTGTVQVQKFTCPAGEEGERSQFMGGAQGNQQLKQTAGCNPSVATFTLVAEDGSTESNATFKTNQDGRAQLTAVEGIYLLTETDPDLPGNSAARIRVGVGQMTTVIVINYVAPPAPAPVTINVEGFTCPPGFNGSSFVDFQNSCMADSQLTNQITVRAESGNRYKRVTGDTGVVGKTAFTELPAGTYTIWAERPFSIPVSYLFCGTNAQNPNLKSVNGTVSAALQSGDTINCRVFQVPSLFDANNGAIQVQKYNCPIEERQRGYDYKNECSRATEPIPFEIVQLDPKTRDAVGQPIRVNSNADGIVQFPMLAPGTYKLTEVESEWCFAQSNSVDAKGDVVVTKNKLSEVWIYNCVGTTSPPNTGSGDAAEILNPGSDSGPMQMLPNLIWPTVLLAGWLVWRDRKQA